MSISDATRLANFATGVGTDGTLDVHDVNATGIITAANVNVSGIITATTSRELILEIIVLLYMVMVVI